MKRALYAAACLVVVLAVVWVAGPYLFPGAGAEVAVVTTADGTARLSLTVNRPGLFVDVTVPEGAAIQAALVAGRRSAYVFPWPGQRRRVPAFFRGPVEIVLAQGAGPFDVTNLPAPVAGGDPSLVLPDGWSRLGAYVGRFDVTEGDPVAVAVPAGMADGPAVVAKVRKLYAEAEKQFGRPPVRAKVAVVTGPEPDRPGRAVADLWVADYAPGVRWLQTGAAEYYAVRLLDAAKLWTPTDKTRWERQHLTDKGYALALWLDASLRHNEVLEPSSLDTLLVKTQSARTTADVVKAVNAIAGLGVADHLDRMLAGKDPLPINGH